MSPCDNPRFALRRADLVQIARSLGYEHLAQRLARRRGSLVARRFARRLALASAGAQHVPHGNGDCQRVGVVDGREIIMATKPSGSHQRIIAARWRTPVAALANEEFEYEAHFDEIIG